MVNGPPIGRQWSRTAGGGARVNPAAAAGRACGDRLPRPARLAPRGRRPGAPDGGIRDVFGPNRARPGQCFDDLPDRLAV